MSHKCSTCGGHFNNQKAAKCGRPVCPGKAPTKQQITRSSTSPVNYQADKGRFMDTLEGVVREGWDG
jgi:hypothetical protein